MVSLQQTSYLGHLVLPVRSSNMNYKPRGSSWNPTLLYSSSNQDSLTNGLQAKRRTAQQPPCDRIFGTWQKSTTQYISISIFWPFWLSLYNLQKRQNTNWFSLNMTHVHLHFCLNCSFFFYIFHRHSFFLKFEIAS